MVIFNGIEGMVSMDLTSYWPKSKVNLQLFYESEEKKSRLCCFWHEDVAHHGSEFSETGST